MYAKMKATIQKLLIKIVINKSWKRGKSMKQVYLDNAATTPVRLEAEAAMRPYFCEKYEEQ